VTWNQPLGPPQLVACIDELHTMRGACPTAVIRWIDQQSQCERPHQFLGSPCMWSAIWRECKNRQWEGSKTSKRGQCSNEQGVGYETRFSKDNWESTYFKIFWKSWNSPSYCRECLLYWLCWHLVIEPSSLTVKQRKSASRYYPVWMWRHVGIRHWRCLTERTDYEN